MALRVLLLIIGLPLLAALAITVGVVLARGPSLPGAGPAAQGPLSTAFTYQGRLTGAGGPVNDTCDFQFSLYDAPSEGTQVGGPIDRPGVPVADGLFSVPLDFGSGAFDGSDRFLEIQVRCLTGSPVFTTLSPRQSLTPAPYAIHAVSAGSAQSAPWSGLTDVPPGFADDKDDDALAGLACEHNQVAKWNHVAEEWQCADLLADVHDSQGFTEKDAFVVPAGVRRVEAEVWGAGGGGGKHGSGSLAGGGGGGSGGYTRAFIDVIPGETLAVVIGAGGAPGTDGGSSSIVREPGDVLAAASGGATGQPGQDGDCASNTPDQGARAVWAARAVLRPATPERTAETDLSTALLSGHPRA